MDIYFFRNMSQCIFSTERSTMKNAIVGQSGGPTSVINSSLAGVYEAAKSRGAEHV